MARKPRSGRQRGRSAPREAAFGDEGKTWGVMRKAPKRERLHPEEEKTNRIIALPLSRGRSMRQWQPRARVARPFCILKRQYGYVKTR